MSTPFGTGFWRAVVALAALALVADPLSGCCDEETPKTGPAPFTTTSSGTNNTSSGGGQGATGGGGNNAGGGGMEKPTSDDPCNQEVAFQASGIGFMSPTPIELASVLNKLAYDDTYSHPLSIVLSASMPDVKDPMMAISATEDLGSGTHTFINEVPKLVSASVGAGHFYTVDQQEKGYLHIRHQAGEVDIELSNIYLTAETSQNCNKVFATLIAIIPDSQGSIELTFDNTTKTIAELAAGNGGGGGAGGGKPPAPGWQLQALFLGETINFDFGTLY